MTVDLVAILFGILVWVLVPTPKAQEAGRLVFFAAVLAALFAVGQHRLF